KKVPRLECFPARPFCHLYLKGFNECIFKNKPNLSDQYPLCSSFEFLKVPGGLIEMQILVPEI
ncbi:hypothetical protein, partial [Pseudomonas syringae]|uniref:hypothetical protein n=1 Tax=Pseudomonas syringae TaxID=317 RepID=UPI0034D4B7C4